MRKLYRNYIKNNWFIKLILVYASIVLVTIVSLSYFAYYYLSRSVVQHELDIQVNAMNSIDNYLKYKFDAVQLLMQDIYRDQELSDNVSYLLKNSYEDYITHRLDQYSENGNGSRKGLEYFQLKIEDDPDIMDIILYSTDGQFLYWIDEHKQIKAVKTNIAHSYVPDAMLLSNNAVTKPNEWVIKSIGQLNNKLFAISNVINDMATYSRVGQMLVCFNSEGVYKVLENAQNHMLGSLLVLTPDGEVLFDSAGYRYDQTLFYAEVADKAGKLLTADKSVYINTLSSSSLGYTIVGIAPKNELAAKTMYLKRLIILISTICLVIAIMAPAIFVGNFARRVKRMIRMMRKVETGDMTVRIQEDKEDELGQISRGFNEMMDKLSRYIDRVFKSEIKQKQTELAALQARVNPHFLYNTLEVIRMRALSTGSNDVSDMIYNLAGLFRSIVKQQSFVTLREEIDVCCKYLELFRIRYQDNFTYRIDVPPELAELHAAKMLLQPIVENYFVHGLNPEQEDNELRIQASGTGDSVRIVVQDRGHGIERDKLEAIRSGLFMPEELASGASFGLRSVVDRLHLLYGNECGLEIESEPGEGN